MGHTVFRALKNTEVPRKQEQDGPCTAQHFSRSRDDSSHCSPSISLPAQSFSPLLLINSHLSNTLTIMYYLHRLWLFPAKNFSYSCTNGEFQGIVLFMEYLHISQPTPPNQWLPHVSCHSKFVMGNAPILPSQWQRAFRTLSQDFRIQLMIVQI